ncbi:MAG: hypothetical protein ABMA64_14670 [Myxococcota bacterium]
MLFALTTLAPTLSISGTCPDVTWEGGGFQPGSPLVVLHSPGEGTAPLESGPCAGLETGLADVGWSRFARAPASGAFSLPDHLLPSTCDHVFQVLDLRTCTLSNVAAPAPQGR